MQDRKPVLRSRWRTMAGGILIALVLLYAALLIPEANPPPPKGAGRAPFIWNRDAFWSGLEKQFQQARGGDPEVLFTTVLHSVAKNLQLLTTLPLTNLPPSAPVFDQAETNFFVLASQAAAAPPRFPMSVFIEAYTQLRREAKRQSEQWAMDQSEARDRLYRLLYGGRAALEEALLQLPPERVPSLVHGDDVPSRSPSAKVHDVVIHSGDILVSRGGAATSALIARGNDYPGNFSHVALIHVDEATGQVSAIESHIESGVSARPFEAYLQETKLRIMVLRLRPDLPQMSADPLLPHKAASHALSEAKSRHIPYDFAMDHHDPSKQFCSEVASAAYRSLGVNLWMGVSRLSSRGVTSWLSALGVRHFETQEPSDLEYDPQLRVVAEWRDPETLFKDHVDNAIIDAMLERAEAGERLGYDWYRLPLVRLAKAYSVCLNWRGKVGPVPEGMSAATALRVQRLTQRHTSIQERVFAKADAFKQEQGYVPPYWELVRLAREAQEEIR